MEFSDLREGLFYERDLSQDLHDRRNALKVEVEDIPRDRFMRTSIEALVEHFVGRFRIEPLEIQEEHKTMDEREASLSTAWDPMRGQTIQRSPIPGVQVIVSVPFTGDPSLWLLKPRTFTSVHPRAAIRTESEGAGCIEISITQPSDQDQTLIKSELESRLRLVQQYLDWQRPQVAEWNQILPAAARSLVDARRARLVEQEGLPALLGIRLKRRSDAPPLTSQSLVKRSPPTLPPVSHTNDHVGIRSEDFENILRIIGHVGRTFEATPGTYRSLGEEELRDIFLAHLNGHYEGGATGETFRKSGKTDVRIEDESRAAFVAEFKLWEGPKKVASACDQLLDYLTWRDCKCALVVFNKDVAQFSSLREKLPQAIRGHERFRREVEQRDAGEWRFVIADRHDEGREIMVHAFLFNLHVPATRRAKVGSD